MSYSKLFDAYPETSATTWEVDMIQAHGLYYPFMRVRDLDWLKASILFWDKIWRLQPVTYQIHDEPELKVLVDEGLARSLHPEGYANELAGDLLRFMDDNRALLREHYSISRIMNDADGPNWGSDGPEGPNRGLAWIHASKMSYEFERFVHEEGLARIGRGDDWQWVGVHETVAMAYMIALASSCASANQMELITDLRAQPRSPVGGIEAAMNLLTAGQTNGQPETSSPDCARFAMLAIESVMPRNLGSIHIDRVLKIRQTLAEELTAFRSFVSEQRQDLEEIAKTRDSDVRAEQFATHLEEKIKQPVKQLRKGYRLLNIETIKGLITVESVALPAVASSALHSLPVMAAVAGVSLVVGNAWWQRKETLRQLASNSPASYLLSLDKAFRAELAAKRMMKILQYA